MSILVLEFFNLFCAGLLAGIEVCVHYAVHPSFIVLDDKAQIHLRQNLIRKLRWMVPGFFVPMTLSGIVTAIIQWLMPGHYFSLAAMLFIVIWIVVRIVGTVPVNSATINWNPDTPPKDWKKQVSRVERFHIVGTGAAIMAFVLFLTALVLNLS
ncbi:MAG: DUF1772 domain-containing protein [Bacteroidetes bacterium]|nr:DUF1772 domain-containing protein [Bacteroidota bacterium]